MKIRTLIIASVFPVMILTPNVQASSCKQEYRERIDKIPTYHTGNNIDYLLYADIVGAGGGYLVSSASFVSWIY